VDATRTFSVGDGNLAFNRINLMPGATPGRIVLNGDVNVTPLAGAAAVIANGSGAGTSGRIDLNAANRVFSVTNGAADADLTISVPVINGGLTKAGAGTLALTGANNYLGDTIVEEGRLRLGSATLANGADVYLTTGSLLDLTFSSGAPDVIDSLFIDGASMQAGVWGAEGSGAEFTSPLITGTGRLQVTTFIAPIPGDFNGDGVVDSSDLTAWQGGYGMAGAGTENGDADGDGVVDGGDFLTWQQNAGATSSPAAAASAAAVPEPAAAALLLAAAVGVAGRRLRK
jgi:autotransporter-associated beta strand protein